MKRFFGGALTLLLASHATAETFRADVWADNWFALYADGRLVGQDQISINTERSFNAESFTFPESRPFTLAIMAKDFKENDTGLEYIGTRRQQMGDGGLILQIKDAAGETVAVSNSDWQCKVLHEAPLDKACAKERTPRVGQGPCGFTSSKPPRGWTAGYFDDSGWASATEYSKQEVRPKGGYSDITWSRAAKFIWGPDLETNNTVICRLTVY